MLVRIAFISQGDIRFFYWIDCCFVDYLIASSISAGFVIFNDIKEARFTDELSLKSEQMSNHICFIQRLGVWPQALIWCTPFKSTFVAFRLGFYGRFRDWFIQIQDLSVHWQWSSLIIWSTLSMTFVHCSTKEIIIDQYAHLLNVENCSTIWKWPIACCQKDDFNFS